MLMSGQVPPHTCVAESRRGLWRGGLVGIVLVVLFGGLAPPALGTADSLRVFTRTLDARVPAWLQRYGVPGAALALVRDGRVVWTGAYGVADRASGRAMTTDAVFRAESISKSVTAWGVLRLVAEGRLGLDAPVRRSLDGPIAAALDTQGAAVTVRHLLSHTAGLPLGPVGPGAEHPPAGPTPSLRSYLEREVRLVRPPGARFAYSNVGFNLLERIVGRVTDREFTAYMDAAVLGPMGMTRSRFGAADSLAAAMPVGYDLQGRPVAPYVYAATAAGGLRASAPDVARFVAALVARGDSVVAGLDGAQRRQLSRPQAPVPGLLGVVAEAYGLGHFVETLPDGRRAVWHGGQGHGWMAHMHAVPASGDGLVILTNSQRSWPFFARVLGVWARWAGLETVGMTWVTTATRGAQGLVAAVGVWSLWMVYRLVTGLQRGRRRWAPTASTAWGWRLLQAGVGGAVLLGLVWSVLQPYLTLAAVFPTVIGWAGRTFLLWAVLLLLSAACPDVR